LVKECENSGSGGVARSGSPQKAANSRGITFLEASLLISRVRLFHRRALAVLRLELLKLLLVAQLRERFSLSRLFCWRSFTE